MLAINIHWSQKTITGTYSKLFLSAAGFFCLLLPLLMDIFQNNLLCLFFTCANFFYNRLKSMVLI